MQNAQVSKINTDLVAPFSYRWMGQQVLVTNDLGSWLFLDQVSFKSFVEGTLDTGGSTYEDLASKGFIPTELDKQAHTDSLKERMGYFHHGPSRHTIALSNVDGSEKMSLLIGERTIDMAFQSNAQRLQFIFVTGQGPLNWDTLTSTVDFANMKNSLARKTVEFVLRGSLDALKPKQIKWLLANDFRFEADFDAATLAGEETPLRNTVAAIHEKLVENGANHRVVARINPSEQVLQMGPALLQGLRTLGVQAFVLRTAGDGRQTVSPSDFGPFYRSILQALLDDDSDAPLWEQTAVEFIGRIFGAPETALSTTRTLGTDGIGELAYGWDGTIYSSDEGRMLGDMGDPLFALGKVTTDNYQMVVTHPTVRALVLASVTDGQPGFVNWVYKPFCGSRASQNYIDQGSIQGRAGDSNLFGNHQVILDSIFEVFQQQGASPSLFQKWSQA
ncbi:MAG: hypothetical protein CMH53_00660 [Myxococcales bacterium]|nr:hypothetical protein [Myxococcales bacterium]